MKHEQLGEAIANSLLAGAPPMTMNHNINMNSFNYNHNY